MKKAIKIISAILIIALIAFAVFLKTAVGSRNIYISTGFDSDTLIKVDHTDTSMFEVMLHITDMANEYEGLFGDGIFEENVNELTFEQFVIQYVKGKLTRIKCMNQVALDKGIVLSNQEESNLIKATNEYYSGLSKTSIKKYSITEDKVKMAFRNMLMADKLFDDLTYAVNTEISEDEARVILIQYIKADSYSEAAGYLNRIKEGESFSSIVKTTNPYEYSYELTRGEVDEKFEEVAFNLITGEISDVVETDSGFYIILCINEYDKLKTAANKAKMIEKNKLATFNEAFEKYEAMQYAEYNEELWAKITVNDRIEASISFNDIYQKYFAN